MKFPDVPIRIPCKLRETAFAWLRSAETMTLHSFEINYSHYAMLHLGTVPCRRVISVLLSMHIQKQNKRLWHIAQINKKFKLMYSMLKRWLGKKVTEFSIVWESCYVKLSDCIPLKTREISNYILSDPG
jgi:hypothetical protein